MNLSSCGISTSCMYLSVILLRPQQLLNVEDVLVFAYSVVPFQCLSVWKWIIRILGFPNLWPISDAIFESPCISTTHSCESRIYQIFYVSCSTFLWIFPTFWRFSVWFLFQTLFVSCLLRSQRESISAGRLLRDVLRSILGLEGRLPSVCWIRWLKRQFRLRLVLVVILGVG